MSPRVKHIGLLFAASVDEQRQKQGLSLFVAKTGEYSIMLARRFQSRDRFTGRLRLTLQKSFNPELIVLRRRRGYDDVDKPGPKPRELFLRHIHQTKKTPQVRVSSRIDMVLEAIAFCIFTSFSEGLESSLTGFRIVFKG